ncbi:MULTISPECIES: helix-turn-helix domain-containing protein [unclassified Bradyrhizobium]|uniref:helix-turn-helix domain-containing protein n=2 Tax=unclassified Bradyrhizobium TaxID=2631580 RepID=UPI0033939855
MSVGRGVGAKCSQYSASVSRFQQRFCWHESMSNNRREIRPWSPEEEAQLLALFNEGMTATELGERLGRSRQAVYGRLQRFRKQRGRTSRRSGQAFAQWVG